VEEGAAGRTSRHPRAQHVRYLCHGLDQLPGRPRAEQHQGIDLMMSKMFPFAVFTAVFAFVYYACFVFGYTPVRYYPLLGEIAAADLPRSAGPAMGWYTWIVIGAAAGLVAGVAAMLVPKGISERLA